MAIVSHAFLHDGGCSIGQKSHDLLRKAKIIMMVLFLFVSVIQKEACITLTNQPHTKTATHLTLIHSLVQQKSVKSANCVNCLIKCEIYTGLNASYLLHAFKPRMRQHLINCDSFINVTLQHFSNKIQ